MANTTITKILLRRGPEIDRESIIPTMGEPLFTTDTHRLYIGDGETDGVSLGTTALCRVSFCALPFLLSSFVLHFDRD